MKKAFIKKLVIRSLIALVSVYALQILMAYRVKRYTYLHKLDGHTVESVFEHKWHNLAMEPFVGYISVLGARDYDLKVSHNGREIPCREVPDGYDPSDLVQGDWLRYGGNGKDLVLQSGVLVYCEIKTTEDPEQTSPSPSGPD